MMMMMVMMAMMMRMMMIDLRARTYCACFPVPGGPITHDFVTY